MRPVGVRFSGFVFFKGQSNQDLVLHEIQKGVGFDLKSTNSCVAMLKLTVLVTKVL